MWADEPIRSRSDDALGRTGYAERVADLITRSHTWESSVVFGLAGAWGSGKSSLIEMIVESLRERRPGWEIARFTPWATSDVAGLLAEFYAAVAQALPAEKAIRFRKAVGVLARVTAPAANLVPVAGGVVSEAVKAVGERLAADPPWHQAFDVAASRLKEVNARVLVVADDIDRLQPDELVALLKVVRLLGRFPGVQYLLAYDDSTLFQTLESAGLADRGSGAAERFMEKIVQYPLHVPPLLGYQLVNRLDRGIRQALREAGRVELDSDRLSDVVGILESCLATPRAIERFLAQLRHHLPILPAEEINDVDVILLTLLRVTFPRVFAKLPRWRSELLTGHTGEFRIRSGAVEYEPVDWSVLVDDIPQPTRVSAEKLLTSMFPKLRQGQVHTDSGIELRRICEEEYFDRYFLMGIPEHDISDSAVRQAVVDAAEGNPANLRTTLLDGDHAKSVRSRKLSRLAWVRQPSTTSDSQKCFVDLWIALKMREPRSLALEAERLNGLLS